MRQSERMSPDTNAPKPLYEQVKSYVLKNIENGEWPTYHQIPSEHTLVREMGISRMTIHRALRELTQDGFLDRIQGVGTFVAEARQKSTAFDMKDIDVAIHELGKHHQCDVHFLQAEPLTGEFSARLGMREGEQVFRSYIVHRENGTPVMLEDRYVNPAVAPDFLNQDFTQKNTERYFRTAFSLISHDHQILAVAPTPEAHHFLELDQSSPCMQINRRTWTGNKILSAVRLTFPSHRYQINW